MGQRTDDTVESQRRLINECFPPDLRRSIMTCFVGLVALTLFTQTVVATGGDSGQTSHSPEAVHVLLEFSQLLIGVVAVGTAIAGVQAVRGGRMEWAFYSLTAGVIVFLLQRMWHSVHEFGLLLSPPNVVTQLLFLGATVLLSLGFLQVYRVMR